MRDIKEVITLILKSSDCSWETKQYHFVLLNYQVCTGKRGENLDSSEKQCLNHCMDRYADTMNVVNQSLVSRQTR